MSNYGFTRDTLLANSTTQIRQLLPVKIPYDCGDPDCSFCRARRKRAMEVR